MTPPASAFDTVKKIGLEFPDVEAVVRYDGATVLKAGGVFMAGIATHPSAEPDSLVVRVDLEQREFFLEDAPDAYYVTDYYRPYPIVLVRLSRVNHDALHDLLAVSWRLAMAKVKGKRTPLPKNQKGS